ncbi:17473_t:CDS:2 [Cetraspora pellucida]|uniref:17473_t:CDS:1 n=1 Tax=Cetraspora pellucida TaxID=1433469 RepID=A0ACA9JVK2_9GLOM|nr:17473_t:CDS:2 [Cetraspora pellucida]
MHTLDKLKDIHVELLTPAIEIFFLNFAQRYAGGPEKHKLTEDIIVLGAKPTNKHNTYSVYKVCDDALGHDEALKSSLTNKKIQTDNEEESTSQIAKRHRNMDVSDEEDTSNMTSSTTTSTASNHNSKQKSLSTSVTNFIVWGITTKEKPKFERLLLQMTISNRCQHALSNHILNAKKSTLTQFHEQKLKNNKNGVTLAFDEWKNILKQHIFSFLFILSTATDISSERECIIEIIFKIESMINEASDINAKLSAIISDSAPAYSGVSICDTWFKTNTDNLNFIYLAQFITYYYKAWFEHQPTCILLEFEKYRKYEYLFDHSTDKQFKESVLEFWNFAFSSTKELELLATWLFGICVNAASIKQLWSSMRFIHTN